MQPEWMIRMMIPMERLCVSVWEERQLYRELAFQQARICCSEKVHPFV